MEESKLIPRALRGDIRGDIYTHTRQLIFHLACTDGKFDEIATKSILSLIDSLKANKHKGIKYLIYIHHYNCEIQIPESLEDELGSSIRPVKWSEATLKETIPAYLTKSVTDFIGADWARLSKVALSAVHNNKEIRTELDKYFKENNPQEYRNFEMYRDLLVEQAKSGNAIDSTESNAFELFNESIHDFAIRKGYDLAYFSDYIPFFIAKYMRAIHGAEPIHITVDTDYFYADSTTLWDAILDSGAYDGMLVNETNLLGDNLFINIDFLAGTYFAYEAMMDEWRFEENNPSRGVGKFSLDFRYRKRYGFLCNVLDKSHKNPKNHRPGLYRVLPEAYFNTYGTKFMREQMEKAISVGSNKVEITLDASMSGVCNITRSLLLDPEYDSINTLVINNDYRVEIINLVTRKSSIDEYESNESDANENDRDRE